MRVLRSIWVSLVNFVLLFSPLVILVVFLVQFGQPIVELYREYFLGNPAQELIQTTRTLHNNPGSEVPFGRLDRQFDGLQTMEAVSDTEADGIHRSIVRVHGAVVSRLGSGDLLAVVDSYSDSYTQLLNHSALEQVYERPKLVRQKLRDDLGRIRKLPRLPSHPVKGLDAFWVNSDTVATIVEEYGSIYANQVSCEQVFKVDCGDVYDESVKLSSEYIAQYLSNWPNFDRNLPDQLDVFNRRVGPLVDQFFEFTNTVEGYLQATPWQRYQSLLDTYDEYKANYRGNLGEWYAVVIESFSLAPRDFSERQWSQDYARLQFLRDIERTLQESARVREVVLTKSNRNLRQNLLRRLENLYIEVNALDQFESGFTLSGDGLESLRATIRSFPNGTDRLNDQNQRLREARDLFEAMQAAISDRRYDDLLESLRSVQTRLQANQDSTLWNIMGTKFLLLSRDQITTPEWQPTTGESHETYRGIVQLYGDMGNTLGLDALSEGWVEQTLIALKSRRFNQLKHNLLTEVEDFRTEDLTRVRELLEEIQNIEDLPEQLANRSASMIFEVAILERLVLGEANLHATFSGLFESRSRFQTAWTGFERLVSILESEDPPGFLKDRQLKDFTRQWGNWLNNYTGNSAFDELILKQARGRLLSFVEGLIAHFKQSVRDQNPGSRNITVLLRQYKNISEGLTLINQLPGLESEYSLGQWRNILIVRRKFSNINSSANNLKKGSLWSDNTTFNKYKEQLSSFEWRSFPLNYDAQREVSLLRGTTDRLRRKAVELDESSQDDWLPGWGGRVQPGDILEPWISFLGRLNDATRHPEVASVATAMQQESQKTLRDLE